MPILHSAFKTWLLLMLFLVMMLFTSLLLGSTSPTELWVLWQQGDANVGLILWQLRLPRALAAIFCGALLALGGCLMQVQLRNPLADPYILGVSGGAAVGSLLTLLFIGNTALPLGAGLGAVFTLFLVLGLGGQLPGRERVQSENTSIRLILLGAMLASMFSAFVSLLLVFTPQEILRGALFWLMGDLGGAQVPSFLWLAALVLVVLCLRLTRDLNVLCRGEDYAFSVGVSVIQRRWQIIVLASFATAFAVIVGGTIGFIGLVIPHALRSIIGNDQRLLLPAAMLSGAVFLLGCDTIARTILAPIQLPVGVITALVGAPAFIILLLRSRSDRCRVF